MDRYIKAIVDFTSRLLYLVATRHLGHDNAFQRVLREKRSIAKLVPLRVLYRVSRSMINDYYTVRYLENKIYGGEGGFRRLVRLWLIYRGIGHEELEAYSTSIERLRNKFFRSTPGAYSSIEDLVEAIEDTAYRIAVKHSYPLWLVKTLLKHLGISEAEELLKALNEEKWWIRVNTLKADVEHVIESLLSKGVVVRKDRDLDYMLEVISYNKPLYQLEEVWKGYIILQDKASAMVVEALEPSEHDTILDMAAAPGVKDTLIMQLTNNSARIIAVDVSLERLKRAKKVMRMYGIDLSKIELVNMDSTRLQLSRAVDKVLIDAPCSSSGAIGKDPAIKIHLKDESWVGRFLSLQEAMIRRALYLGNKPYIVYAVCSILPFEGEEQISKLSSTVEVLKPRIPGSPGYSSYGPLARKFKRFYPHIHFTQGFFISKFRRV